MDPDLFIFLSSGDMKLHHIYNSAPLWTGDSGSARLHEFTLHQRLCRPFPSLIEKKQRQLSLLQTHQVTGWSMDSKRVRKSSGDPFSPWIAEIKLQQFLAWPLDHLPVWREKWLSLPAQMFYSWENGGAWSLPRFSHSKAILPLAVNQSRIKYRRKISSPSKVNTRIWLADAPGMLTQDIKFSVLVTVILAIGFRIAVPKYWRWGEKKGDTERVVPWYCDCLFWLCLFYTSKWESPQKNLC